MKTNRQTSALELMMFMQRQRDKRQRIHEVQLPKEPAGIRPQRTPPKPKIDH